MNRVSMKPACLLVLFIVASLLPSSLMAHINVGPNKKELFMTGQLCNSHDDCKANSVGFGSTLGVVSKTEKKKKKKKPKPAGKCGKCETSDDCKGCPAAAACEKIVLNGFCA